MALPENPTGMEGVPLGPVIAGTNENGESPDKDQTSQAVELEEIEEVVNVQPTAIEIMVKLMVLRALSSAVRSLPDTFTPPALANVGEHENHDGRSEDITDLFLCPENPTGMEGVPLVLSDTSSGHSKRQHESQGMDPLAV